MLYDVLYIERTTKCGGLTVAEIDCPPALATPFLQLILPPPSPPPQGLCIGDLSSVSTVKR